jgi:hypothetical protein
MNAKRAKKLRKVVAKYQPAEPTIAYHDRPFMDGEKLVMKQVVNPIEYPALSRRRLYQDAKRAENQ